MFKAQKEYVQSTKGDLKLAELPRFPDAAADEIAGGLVAPMPGAVLTTEVKAGDQVAQGDLLLILEAMKMEHRITAPMEGTVSELHVQEGDQVNNGQLLVTLSEED
jgi:propionyl-CoA carboxylase alpha chain